MTADLEEAGGVGEAEQSLCHRLDPPRTMASVRNSGALSQEELELRMQAGPAFCSWSLSIKKKKERPTFYYRNLNTPTEAER